MMIRRRRSPAASESLELLLDTLCNTFGGVLFIALLVVLMLRPGERMLGDDRAGDSTPDDFEAMARELDVIRAEVDTLRTTLASQELLIAGTIPEDRDEARDELDQALEAVREAEAEADRMLAETARLRAETLANEATLASLESDLAERRGLRDAAQSRLDEARRANQTAVSPGSNELKSTTKRSLGLILRHDRVYVWHRYDRSGNPVGLNTDEFLIVEDTPEGLVTLPKRTAGIPIRGESAAEQLRRRLAPFSPRVFALDIVLHPDSFDTFQDFKRTILELGYQYRLLLKGEFLTVYDRGGTDDRVQ